MLAGLLRRSHDLTPPEATVSRWTTIAIVALALGAGSCSDTSLAPRATHVRPHVVTKDVDLDPSAGGYFLDGVSPASCYYESNPGTDADLDWLNDDCEYQIAQAFRPYLWFSVHENCPSRNPTWAVHRFVNDSAPKSPGIR